MITTSYETSGVASSVVEPKLTGALELLSDEARLSHWRQVSWPEESLKRSRNERYKGNPLLGWFRDRLNMLRYRV